MFEVSSDRGTISCRWESEALRAPISSISCQTPAIQTLLRFGTLRVECEFAAATGVAPFGTYRRRLIAQIREATLLMSVDTAIIQAGKKFIIKQLLSARNNQMGYV